MSSRSVRLRTALRFLDRHRRLAAALCAALAVGAALSVVAPAPGPTTAVLTAARELSAGQVLSASDVTAMSIARGSAPDGALTSSGDVIGRSVALPVRRGEILTDFRIEGSALRRNLAAGGLLIAPVRIADPAAVALLAAGDHVDILGAVEGQSHAAVVAAGVLVVSVPVVADGAVAGGDGGALLVVATSLETSRRLAQAAIASRLSVVLRA